MTKRQFTNSFPVRTFHISRVISENNDYDIPKDSHYETLGLPLTASMKSIKARFYEMSKKYHPDRNRDPSASVKFLQISQAYEVIGDKSKRDEYDMSIQYRDQGHSSNFLRNQVGGRPATGLSRRRVKAYRSPIRFSGGVEPKNTEIPFHRFNYNKHYLMHYKHEQLQKERRISRQKTKDAERPNTEHDLSRIIGVSLIVLAITGFTGLFSHITLTKHDLLGR